MPPVTEILSLLIVAAAFAITALGCRLVDVSQINRSTVLAPDCSASAQSAPSIGKQSFRTMAKARHKRRNCSKNV
jgi:hypothetical protein